MPLNLQPRMVWKEVESRSWEASTTVWMIPAWAARERSLRGLILDTRGHIPYGQSAKKALARSQTGKGIPRVELGDLNLPVKVSDAINAALAAIGIVLPLAVTQGFVLILCVVALAYGIIKLRRREGTALLSVLIVAGFGLFAAGVGISWIDTVCILCPERLKARWKCWGVPAPTVTAGCVRRFSIFTGKTSREKQES